MWGITFRRAPERLWQNVIRLWRVNIDFKKKMDYEIMKLGMSKEYRAEVGLKNIDFILCIYYGFQMLNPLKTLFINYILFGVQNYERIVNPEKEYIPDAFYVAYWGRI